MIYIVMGVSGSGKTTVGMLLAQTLGCGFRDADEFHSEQNKAKMAAGIALTDEDRWPWLDAMRAAIEACRARGEAQVFACSALRQAYRERLTPDEDGVCFVYLKGDIETIRGRLAGRKGHFFDPRLLQSQFDTLEEPRDALVLDVRQPPEVLVRQILDRAAHQPASPG
ncbi:gluconokinase [Cupriavidus sp. AU9028]|uniref:gluconokinase n=1 Tax=Cupriavidus sp. AU9028 TaxID=2871157 RepID=UPI001C988412|nr:gluconokinase [Cupriavidus sp. AU9028]MBY4898726.1 gluconokinase [Cupriavidus sp. AU9028]